MNVPQHLGTLVTLTSSSTGLSALPESATEEDDTIVELLRARDALHVLFVPVPVS